MPKPIPVLKILKPCRTCHPRDNDCQGHWHIITDLKGNRTQVEHYEISEIRYCRQQVAWILAEFYRVGTVRDRDREQIQPSEVDEIVCMRDSWPPDPLETGYIEAPIIVPRSAKTPGAAIRGVVCEVEHRLKRTGSDGRELLLMLEHGRKLGELSGRAWLALNYCSGYVAKKQDYHQWVWGRLHQSEN